MLAISITLFTSCSKDGWAPIDLIATPHDVNGESLKHRYKELESANAQADHHEIYVLKNQFEVSDSMNVSR